MRTYTTFLQDYLSLTDNSEANQTMGAIYTNDSIRTICNLQGGKLRFLEATKTMTTVANQETYQIPNGFRKLIDMYIYDGAGASDDTIYAPKMIFDPTIWKRILQSHLGTQQVPYFTYVENTTFKIQPIPSVTGNLMVLRGRLQTRDLSIADYTTGTIVSIANGGTAVVGSGTTWTADMVGRYIKITETTAAGGGDGFWYQIGTYTSATSIGLTKPYEGTSIAAGSATYTIGQCSVIPEAYDIAVVYRSAALYWRDKGNKDKYQSFMGLYDGGNEAGLSKEYGGIISQMLANEGETEEGAYIPPLNSGNDFNQNYYYPWQQASGF
jgi:hypothetical protein